MSEFRLDPNFIEIDFNHAIIIKNMDAADEDTRWYGGGTIRVELPLENDIDLPDCPVVLLGADVRDNQMTYRDEISIPFEFHGHVGINIRFENREESVPIYGERMSLRLNGYEKYIEHIRAG